MLSALVEKAEEEGGAAEAEKEACHVVHGTANRQIENCRVPPNRQEWNKLLAPYRTACYNSRVPKKRVRFCPLPALC